MKLFICILVSAVLFACAAKKEEVPAPTAAPNQAAPQQQQNEKAQAAMEKAAAEVDAEGLTDEHFKKDKNVLGIKLKSLKTGGIVSFGDYKGKKIIIDFWSSWCIPCIEMFPDINKLKAEYEDKQGLVKILSISVDPMPGKVLEIVKEKGVTFEVLQATESLANAGILMPFTAVTDTDGKIIAVTNGKHTFEELKKFAGLK